MTSNFRADKLAEAINMLGLKLDESVKWDNEKMIRALGDHFMSLYPENYSWSARYVQSLSTPMLCRHLKEDLKNFSNNPMESSDYVAEMKLNGMRVLMCYTPEIGFELFSRRESSSNYLNGDFTDKVLFIKNGLISEPKDYKGKFNFRFVIDGEITIENMEEDGVPANVSIEDYIQGVLGSNSERAKSFQKEGHRLKITVFDVLYFEKSPKIPSEWTPRYSYDERELTQDNINWVEKHFVRYLRSAEFTKGAGRAKKLYQYLLSLKDSNIYDVRRRPFKQRRKLRTEIIRFLQKYNLPVEEVPYEDTFKIAFLDNILQENGEGVVIKCLEAPYISGMRTSRSHRACLKVKQNIANMLNSGEGLIEDFDVFITGANPPKSERITDMIGSLSCSIYIKMEDGSIKEHEIANISGITHEWKKKLAYVDPETGIISLNPDYKDKVIPINGLALTGSNLKFQHAVLKENGKLEFKDKNPSECTWDIDTLKEMSIIRGE